jgi:hypothetical protein
VLPQSPDVQVGSAVELVGVNPEACSGGIIEGSDGLCFWNHLGRCADLPRVCFFA